MQVLDNLTHSQMINVNFSILIFCDKAKYELSWKAFLIFYGI
jgi:hypothetical protein